MAEINAPTALDRALKSTFHDDARHRHAARTMLLTAGVWMPLEVYRRWPVMLPWVVRGTHLLPVDGSPDLRGTADPKRGYLRDDNSRVWSLGRQLPIKASPSTHPLNSPSPLNHKTLGAGWQASHCWITTSTRHKSAYRPWTNTFVPNLVWLPKSISILTDLDGRLFQQEAQLIAAALYRDAEVISPLRDTVEAIWNLLPIPSAPQLTADELARVNWFGGTHNFHTKLWKRLDDVGGLLARLDEGRSLESQRPKRFAKTLGAVQPAGISRLRAAIEPFLAASAQTGPPTPPGISTNGPPGKKPSAKKSASSGPKPKYYVDGVEVKYRNRAALRVVREALKSRSVSPEAIAELLSDKLLRSVPERLNDSRLTQALAATGASGVPAHWFIKLPIHFGDRTWVVNSQWWFAEDEHLLTKIAEMSGGAVTFRVELP